jgi:hypothetical protein
MVSADWQAALLDLSYDQLHRCDLQEVTPTFEAFFFEDVAPWFRASFLLLLLWPDGAPFVVAQFHQRCPSQASF